MPDRPKRTMSRTVRTINMNDELSAALGIVGH